MDVKYIEFENADENVIVIFCGVYTHAAMASIVMFAIPQAKPVSAGFTSFGDLDGAPSFVFHGNSYSLQLNANSALSVPASDVQGTLESSWETPVLSNSRAVLEFFSMKISSPEIGKDEYGELTLKVQRRGMFM